MASEVPRSREQEELVAGVQKALSAGEIDYAFEVHDGGKPVGVITFIHDKYPDNPREFVEFNIAQIGMFRNNGQFASLNEVDIVEHPGDLAATRRAMEKRYEGYMIVPLRADGIGERVLIATPEDVTAGRVDGFAVMDDERIDSEFDGDRSRALRNLEGELQDYNDFATGNVWRADYRSADGKERDTCWGWGGDPIDTAGDFLRDYGPSNATLGMLLR